MPQKPVVCRAAVWQGSDCLLLARVRSVNGQYINSASTLSIQLSVYDKNQSGGLVYTTAVPTLSVFDTLQPWDGVIWTVDKVGYNFLYRLAGASAFPLAHDYEVNVEFTLVDGTNFPLQYDLSAEAVP